MDSEKGQPIGLDFFACRFASVRHVVSDRIARFGTKHRLDCAVQKFTRCNVNK